jgi:UDP-glucose 4-epimerase
MHSNKSYTNPKKKNSYTSKSMGSIAHWTALYILRPMKKVLVTGGAGYIGSHTVIELFNHGFIPVIVDNFSNSDERVLQGLEEILGFKPVVYRTECADYTSLKRVFRDENPDAVIHFAAFKAVGESTEQPTRYYRNNIDSLLTVLELMEEFQVRDIVFSSSCTVYGQPDDLPVSEMSAQKPATSPYGYSKQVGERILSDVCTAKPALRCALLRYFNPIGAHPSGLIGELPFGIPNNLVPYIAQTAAGIREKLTIHGNDYPTPDGTCIRDYIHVCDLAIAHVRALEWLETKEQACEAFNLGQGKGNSVKEVIDTFVRVNNIPVMAEVGPRRSGDVEQVWADADKAHRILNWKTERSLAKALEDAWRWQQHLSK